MVVYHGGEFNAQEHGAFGVDHANEGFFFAQDRNRALRYANGDESKVTAAFLKITNPDPWVGDKVRLAADGRLVHLPGWRFVSQKMQAAVSGG
ncbi:MAG: hypothetical protein IT518_25190 [Burkholderiales bacterium]|nr:hypothetical protein [Burkholderiales bacterium]